MVLFHYGHDERNCRERIVQGVLRGHPYNCDYITYHAPKSTFYFRLMFRIWFEEGKCKATFASATNENEPISTLDFPFEGEPDEEIVEAALDVAESIAKTIGAVLPSD